MDSQSMSSLSLSSEAVEGNSRRNKLPRYLQPSSGSCHDFCKYGKRHESGKNPRRPSPRRQNKKPVNDEYPVEIRVAGKKTAEVELKPQCMVKTNVFDNPEIMKCEVSANSVDRQASDRIKSIKKSGAILSTEPESQSPVARVILRKNMFLVTKSSDRPISATSRSSSRKESSPMTKKATPVRPRSSLDSSPRARNRDKRMSSAMSSPMTLSVTAMKGLASPRGGSFSPRTRSSGLRIQRVQSYEQGGSEVKPAVKNQKKSGKVNIEHHKVKQEGPGKSIRDLEEELNDNEVQEKTLYVIKMETANKYVDSDVNEEVSVDFPPLMASLSPRVPSRSKSPSLSPSNHSESDDEESEYCSTDADDESNYVVDDDDALEGENKHMIKQHFRRGKVVGISSETRSPRRLQFRRGRVSDENHNAESNTKLHFREGESSDGKPDDHQIDSEKVVLRHQDVQGKKDARVLFNNVIEETASKLVETRQSKVKALVSAFETVISLQDGKPSASTVPRFHTESDC